MCCEERLIFEKYVNLVEKCMNHNIDPRDDFVKYASGRFRRENFDKTTGEYPPSQHGCTYVSQSLLDNEGISNIALSKARDLRRSRLTCVQGGIKDYLGSDHFNDFCGGVPAFNDNWNPDNFIWARAAGILSALQYNTLMSLYMDHLNNTKVIFVYIHSFQSSDVINMEEVLKILELDDKKSAEVVNDFNFIKEIYPDDLGDGNLRRTGLELEEYVEIFNFKEFIETALSVTIYDDDIVHFEDGVMHFITFLSRLDRKVLANYLIAMAAYKDFDQRPESPSDEILVNIFRPIIISVGFETYYNKFQDMKARYTIKKFNQSFEPMECKFPADIRETAEDSFRENYDQILEYIAEHYSLSKIVEEYMDLQISSIDFFQNLINIKNHGIPDCVKRLDSLRGYDRDMRRCVHTLFDFIVLHWEKPMAFHFSGNEVSLWSFIIEMRNDDINNENDSEKNKLREILEAQVATYGELIDNFDADSIISTIEAIGYAYHDYKMWMKENETTVKWQNEILSRINLDCDKLFFVAFCQHMNCCSYPRKDIVTFTLMNFEEFSKVFNCSKESKMNPRKFEQAF